MHRAHLRQDELVALAGLRLTTLPRTLIDLLCAQPMDDSIAMVTDALRRRLLTTSDLQIAARDARGRHGAARARSIAVTCAANPYSVLEWRFHQIVGDLGPGWAFNQRVTDATGLVGVVDAIHVGSRVIVELDGRAYHGPDRFQSDRTRDQRLAALGYVVLRFTWEDLARRPDEVRAIIRRTQAQRSRLVRGPS